ncbi:hypothetical protein [Desulfovibrio psychrotolerans]|uniref:NADPH-dependent 7-cyano-7-deazaguanine reductase n=1 Tax=Desulfovibrio psychrotolerans TaxID=415242 RepID=A0A7J0BUL8_9BACT|nr:hypothetical protein [Desulfovibrio psychrotolerans]GFM36882.1 NADPH-dependent 7-cyano-7-deazaguanine reductase [Desulfovibrio psychrotolerans]
MMDSEMGTDRLVLGRQVDYSGQYDPAQLCPIPRALGRAAAGILRLEGGGGECRCGGTAGADGKIPWRHGEDIWNIYELSWLEAGGRPAVAMAVVRVPWDSPCLIESKSLKLYCNSFNMTHFSGVQAVRDAMERDLSQAAGAPVAVEILEPDSFAAVAVGEPQGMCIDRAELPDALADLADAPAGQGEGLGAGGAVLATDNSFVCNIDPVLLTCGNGIARETLFSRLFRSRCPVTGQPDWATVTVRYAGQRIHADSLLRYLVSYREHQGFHEACVERIFADILSRCRPDELEVCARFTRRGGIDINPVRSTAPGPWENLRDPRQ